LNREMIDVNAVIFGLRTAADELARYAPMKVNGRCQMYFDGAILLLKAQEPIKPTVSVDTWICSKCGHTLESQELIDDKENPQILVHEQYQYCPNCGRKVKWND